MNEDYTKFLVEQSTNIAQGEYSKDLDLAYETAEYIAKQALKPENQEKFKKDIREIPLYA